MKFNYHTHTELCFHAWGTNDEFIEAAIKAGFTEIGFSDHSPWPFQNYVSEMRMKASQLDSYAKDIKSLKEKYKNKISIKLGLECEYFEEYMPWLKRQIEENDLDYIILGHHFCKNEIFGKYNGSITKKSDVKEYAKEVEKAVKTGLYSYICHPDIFMKSYQHFDSTAKDASKRIIEASLEANIPLEYNLLGLSRAYEDKRPGYPFPEFWDLVSEMKGKAIIGVDAHIPEQYLNHKLFEEAEKRLSKRGIETVKEIKFFK